MGESLRFRKADIDRELQLEKPPAEYFLVIDDSPTVCELLKRTLEKPGRVVVAVHTGHEAVEQMKDIKYGCIFLDLVMPGMDGVKVLRLIRSLDTQVPVNIITGHPDSPLVAQAERLGVTSVIIKPSRPQDILSVIKV